MTQDGSTGWRRAYGTAPEVFDAFSRAEDPEGRVMARLLAGAGSGGRALELGCGSGRATAGLASAFDLWALDPAPALLALARARCSGLPVRFLRGRAEALPFRDGAFDRLFAAWTLAYLREEAQAAALAEASRVLAPGGSFWLVENCASGDFHELRGLEGAWEAGRVRDLQARGFREVEVVRTELRFPSAAAAEEVLGFLCGEGVRAALARGPRARFSHHALILRRDFA